MHVVFVYENKIISGSDDTTIRVWELNTGQCLRILKGHNSYVRSVFVYDNKIISGSNDTTIRIWDLDTGICLKVFKCHTDLVKSVFVYDSRIISCSLDKSIRITPIIQLSGKCSVYGRVLSVYSTNWIITVGVMDFFNGN